MLWFFIFVLLVIFRCLKWATIRSGFGSESFFSKTWGANLLLYWIASFFLKISLVIIVFQNLMKAYKKSFRNVNGEKYQLEKKWFHQNKSTSKFLSWSNLWLWQVFIFKSIYLTLKQNWSHCWNMAVLLLFFVFQRFTKSVFPKTLTFVKMFLHLINCSKLYQI